MKVKIRTVLIFTFLFASVVPVALFWLWPHSAALQNKIEEVQERHLLLAKNLGSALSTYHNELVSVFRTFAPRIASGEAEYAKDIFSNLHFRHVCVIDPLSGIVKRSFLGNLQPCPWTVPADRLQLFRDLASSDDVALSNVIAPEGEEPRIYLVKKVQDVLVIGSIRTTFFQELQKRISFGRKGHAAIVDGSGRVIAHPLDDWTRRAVDISSVSAVQRMLAGESGVETFYSPALQGDMIAGFTVVEGPGWGVMVPQPLQELEESAARINRYAVVVLVAGLMFVTLIAAWVSTRGARQIDRVAIATLRVAQGESNVRVQKRRSILQVRELSYLESGFNFMAKEIAETRAAEAERTADLEEVHAAEAARTKELEAVNETLREEIAERRLVQAMLQRSEARFRNLFESEPIAIREEDYTEVKAELESVLGMEDGNAFLNFLELNPEFVKKCADKIVVVDANMATLKLYGIENNKKLLTSITRIRNDQDINNMINIISAIRNGKTCLEFETIVKRADGEERVAMARWSVATGYEKDYGRVMITLIDVTEHRLAEERLKQAQKMEAVGQLTGGVAHDFNNLLAVIAGNAELLAEDSLCNTALTNSIIRAVQRGAELTQRLLAFSRLQPLRPRVIDLRDLVSGMSELLTRTLGETIELEMIDTKDVWEALADAGQVENALLNLAINARDAMPNGGKLTVECGNVQLENVRFADDSDPLDGDYVMLSVSDSGVGMTDDVLARAVEPFFTTKEVGKGSGLGLSMVYGFARQSGGDLSIYTEQGKGTTVRLYLPRAMPAEQAKLTEGAETVVPYGRSELVLVIEDDDEVRSLAVNLLRSLRYRVIDVPDAASARKALENNDEVDIILSDVILPGDMSGPQFVEEARAARPGLKVVFMSGYSAEAARSNGFLQSDRVLISKPFNRQQLATVLRDQLDLRAA